MKFEWPGMEVGKRRGGKVKRERRSCNGVGVGVVVGFGSAFLFWHSCLRDMLFLTFFLFLFEFEFVDSRYLSSEC